MLNSVRGTLRGWRRLDPAFAVLAVLPWLLLAVDSRWLYNPLLSVDPWVYFGYSLDYPHYVADLFPGLYYGSRLAWILPGYCLNLLFDVIPARYVLHVGFYYLAAYSLYSVLRRVAGRRNALLVTVLFGTHSYFLRSIGWDYVDGPGLTYNLLGLACIARAVESRSTWLWLMLSGAAGAAMFYCNLFLVVFLPFLTAFYLFQAHQVFTRRTLRTAAGFVLWFGAGALLLTAVLGAVNYRATGEFWFYAPSFQFRHDLSSNANPWRLQGWGWTHAAAWLGIPMATALGSLAYLLNSASRRSLNLRDLRLFLILQYLGCAVIMIGWHAAGGIGLQQPTYTSYLLPSMFLAIGCLVAFPLEHWAIWRYWLLLAAVVLLFALGLRLFASPVAMRLLQFGWLNASLFVAACFIVNLVLRPRWQLLLLVLCGLWLYQTAFRPWDVSGERSGNASLLRIVDSLKLIRQHTDEVPLRFWYNSRESSGPEFNAINAAYLWQWTMVNQDFPALPAAQSLQLGAAGIILSNRSDALQQANLSLNRSHLEAQAFDSGRVSREGVSYQLVFFHLVPLGAQRESELMLSSLPGRAAQLISSTARDAFPLPREKWTLCVYPHSAAHLELRPDGVLVTTHHTRFAYGSRYASLTASKSGVYRFVLQDRIVNGGLSFGVLSGDESHWLASSSPTHKKHGEGTSMVSLHLQAGETVIPVISNNPPTGADGSSTFVITSLRAFAAFDK